jgi:NAD(P)-dependent dehydrogenase (short-subunit alcohol dehydrogenase family)
VPRMSKPDFRGRTAVVTGAASGIGRSTALLLARLGATVHAADLDEAGAASVAREIERDGGRATAHRVDVSDASAVEGLAERVYAAERAVDILHNNAGVGHAGRVEDTTIEEWQRVLGVNLMGVVHGVHAFVPRMLGQGRPAHIVNTASMAGLVPIPEMAPYATSKHAVVGLTESLNAELEPRGIRVSAVCPGVIDTNIISRAHLEGDLSQQKDRLVRLYGRYGSSPDVVAKAVVDAVRRGKLIRTVPRHHVAFLWTLRRISPRLAQPFGRGTQRLLAGRR